MPPFMPPFYFSPGLQAGSHPSNSPEIQNHEASLCLPQPGAPHGARCLPLLDPSPRSAPQCLPLSPPDRSAPRCLLLSPYHSSGGAQLYLPFSPQPSSAPHPWPTVFISPRQERPSLMHAFVSPNLVRSPTQSTFSCLLPKLAAPHDDA